MADRLGVGVKVSDVGEVLMGVVPRGEGEPVILLSGALIDPSAEYSGHGAVEPDVVTGGETRMLGSLDGNVDEIRLGAHELPPEPDTSKPVGTPVSGSDIPRLPASSSHVRAGCDFVGVSTPPVGAVEKATYRADRRINSPLAIAISYRAFAPLLDPRLRLWIVPVGSCSMWRWLCRRK